jgi:hypothetical protein
MSIGPTSGIVGSAAGSPLAQTRGSETERASHDTSGQQRQVDSNQDAENAAGIGQTAEDQQASDRDADGRRIWEVDGQEETPETEPTGPPTDQKPSDETGTTLDLTV